VDFLRGDFPTEVLLIIEGLLVGGDSLIRRQKVLSSDERRGESLRGLPFRFRLVICSQSPSPSPSPSDTSLHSPLSSDMLSSDDSQSMSMGSGGDETVLSTVSITTSLLVVVACDSDVVALASAGAAEASKGDVAVLGSAGVAVAADTAVVTSAGTSEITKGDAPSLDSVGATVVAGDDVAVVTTAGAASPIALSRPPLRDVSLTAAGCTGCGLVGGRVLFAGFGANGFSVVADPLSC